MKFLLLLALQFSVLTGISQNIDIDLLKEINLNRNRSLDPTFEFITDTSIPLSIAGPAAAITYAIIKKDSTSKSNAIVIASSVAIAGIITQGIKFSVQRDRPFETYPFIDKATVGSGYSFPSGHTSAAFSLATSVSIAYPKWYVIAPSFAWAGAVGYSRMALGVHYPSDVFVGAIVGSGSALLSYKLNQWINKKQRSSRK